MTFQTTLTYNHIILTANNQFKTNKSLVCSHMQCTEM